MRKRQNKNTADQAKEKIKQLTDKERLLLLWMIADFSNGNIFYKDDPERLKSVFMDLLPKAAKYMDDERKFTIGDKFKQAINV